MAKIRETKEDESTEAIIPEETKEDESTVDTTKTGEPTEAEIIAARELLAQREESDTAEMDRSKVETKHRIDMTDTVPRFYPLMEGMKEGTRMKATINEFSYSVPRNQDVQVPKVFAEIFDGIRKGETGNNIPKHLLHDAKAAKYAQENAQFY